MLCMVSLLCVGFHAVFVHDVVGCQVVVAGKAGGAVMFSGRADALEHALDAEVSE